MRLVLIGLITVAAAMVIDVQMASLKTAKALGLAVPPSILLRAMR
jgi:hypothetical protein